MENKPIYTSPTGISLIVVVVWILLLNFFDVSVNDTMNNIAIAIVSFYFWQKTLNNGWKSL